MQGSSFFRFGNFYVKDDQRCRRSIVENVAKIKEMVGSDHSASTVSIAQELSFTPNTAWNHLKKVGYTKKLIVWVSHELTSSWLGFQSPNRCLAVTKSAYF